MKFALLTLIVIVTLTALPAVVSQTIILGALGFVLLFALLKLYTERKLPKAQACTSCGCTCAKRG